MPLDDQIDRQNSIRQNRSSVRRIALAPATALTRPRASEHASLSWSGAPALSIEAPQRVDARRAWRHGSTRSVALNGPKGAGRIEQVQGSLNSPRLGPMAIPPGRERGPKSQISASQKLLPGSANRSIAKNTLLPLLPIHNSIATRPQPCVIIC
jgi:hypothetical protein